MTADIPAADLARWAALVEQAMAAEQAYRNGARTVDAFLLKQETAARLKNAGPDALPALLTGYAAKVAECDAAERVVGELEAALRRWDLTASDAGECDCPSCDANRAALASAAAWRKGR